MKQKQSKAFDQNLLDLFDKYVHGFITRREFLHSASKFAAGGLTATAILESLNPQYAQAQQIAKDDARLQLEMIEYPSPKGSDIIKAYLARPANAKGALPGVLVIHENRGLNPHIRDVARRVGLANFLALAPDALTPLGGYPGNDDEGRALQQQLDRTTMTEDFIAAASYLKNHPECNGKIGVVGFCFGGSMANALAVRIPDLNASVAFYGGQPNAEDVSKIKAPLLLHYAGLDQRINAGWPDYEASLQANGIAYTNHLYEEVNHGFHNDTTPRYDEEAATLAWQRTVDFFNKTLR
ncbi:MAG: dienelactone hydrolase family protein [Acidobacteriota bacterium]|nr:dienelactone hydrolase family protein [Acidobacteriota bacterium]